MPRKLRPCGTTAAYSRHLYRKEEPCEACKAANATRANSAPSGANTYTTQADRALQLNPPVIKWRRKNNGIWVAVSVQDPHAETAAQRAWDERMAREQAVLDAMEDEAREVAERFRQHRSNNTSLLQAARTEI